jgi:uncharacterized membrane protein
MEPFGCTATTVATSAATLLAYRAYRKQSLTRSASITAFIVAFLLVGSGLRGFNLLVFYGVAMKATKYKKDIKATIDGTISSNKGSTTRGINQVLACSLLAVILSIVHVILCGQEQPITFIVMIDDDNTTTTTTTRSSRLASQLSCAIVAHHATCLADTLASELGILIGNRGGGGGPFLITQPWKHVPSGTNGGVTVAGCVYSALGGMIIGLSTLIFDFISGMKTTPSASIALVVFAAISGLVGSLLDSLLGATLQQSYYDPDTKMVYQVEDNKPKTAKLISGSNILSNEMVNVVSVALTTVLGGWCLGEMIFSLFDSS